MKYHKNTFTITNNTHNCNNRKITTISKLIYEKLLNEKSNINLILLKLI